jgi:hypothetical protein
VLGDLEGYVLGTKDGIELGFVLKVGSEVVPRRRAIISDGIELGDLEGYVLGVDERGTTLGSPLRSRFVPTIYTVGGLRRRRPTTTVELGTEVGDIDIRPRRRPITVELLVGTEVGRGLGCLVGFLIGGHVGLGLGFLIGGQFGLRWVGTNLFPDFAFFFCEVNAIEFSLPMAFCIVSASAEKIIFSSFVFPFTNVFASLVVLVSALFVSFLKRSISFLTASTSTSVS